MSCLIRNHAAAEVLFSLRYARSIFDSSFASGDPPLLRKTVYLARALISSEHLTPDALSAVLPTVPSALGSLEIDDPELRELTYHLLSTTVESAEGWNLLGAPGPNRERLDELMSQRDRALRAVRNPEENDLAEMKLIKDLRRLLVAPPARPVEAVIVSPAVSRSNSQQDPGAPPS